MSKNMRYVPDSRMMPGITGTPYWAISRGDFLPAASPILSIIDLRLLPSLSVLDELNPAARLWLASLEYVSTIPGCSAIYWGIATNSEGKNENGNEEICLLIEWESPLLWSNFQSSFGLRMMHSCLDGWPINRCARISSVPFGKSPTSLCFARYKLSNEAFAQDQYKITKEWMKWKDDVRQEGIETCAAWLEEDGAWPTPQLTPEGQEELTQIQTALKVAQERVFFVITSQKASFNGDKESEGPPQVKIPQLGGHVAQVRNFSLSQNEGWRSQTLPVTLDKLDVSEQSLHATKTLASLLQIPPVRSYSEKTGMFHNVDMIQKGTVAETLTNPPVRLFPGPRGEFTVHMGDLNEYGPRYAPRLAKTYQSAVDLLCFHVKRGHFDTERLIDKLFLEFRCHIRQLEGCSDLFWSRVDEGGDECIVIIYWKNLAIRTTHSQFVQDSTRDFAAATEKLNKDSETLNSGQANSSNIELPAQTPVSTPVNINVRARVAFPILELTTFSISSDPYIKALFENFYRDFQSTSSLNASVVGPSIPLANDNKEYFFSTSSSPNRTKFTSLIHWRSEAAMEEWYSAFAAGCGGGGYERLGHKIDALRSVELGDIESKVLKLRSDPFRSRYTSSTERSMAGARERIQKRREEKGLERNVSAS